MQNKIKKLTLISKSDKGRVYADTKEPKLDSKLK